MKMTRAYYEALCRLRLGEDDAHYVLEYCTKHGDAELFGAALVAVDDVRLAEALWERWLNDREPTAAALLAIGKAGAAIPARLVWRRVGRMADQATADLLELLTGTAVLDDLLADVPQERWETMMRLYVAKVFRGGGVKYSRQWWSWVIGHYADPTTAPQRVLLAAREPLVHKVALARGSLPWAVACLLEPSRLNLSSHGEMLTYIMTRPWTRRELYTASKVYRSSHTSQAFRATSFGAAMVTALDRAREGVRGEVTVHDAPADVVNALISGVCLPDLHATVASASDAWIWELHQAAQGRGSMVSDGLAMMLEAERGRDLALRLRADSREFVMLMSDPDVAGHAHQVMVERLGDAIGDARELMVGWDGSILDLISCVELVRRG